MNRRLLHNFLTNHARNEIAEALGAVPINAGFAGSGYTVSGSFAPCLTAVDFFSASRPCPDEPAPDVILLEHGQNDGGGCEVTRRCGEVLDRLAEKYPSARLFILIPFTQIRAAEIRAACEGRENVTVIETNNGWFVSTTDGVHPTAKGAYRAGTRLARKLIDRLGEDFFLP